MANTSRRARPGHGVARPAADAPTAPGAFAAFLERRGGAIVAAMMVVYTATFTAISAYKYRHYLYTDFDLAIFAHAVSRLLHGTLYESIGGMNWLGGHVALNLFFAAPIYAIARHPMTLLFLQSAALSLGALAIFQLAKREVGGGATPVILAALYLLHPAVAYSNLYEFHPEALATPDLIFAFAALRAGRLRLMLAWTFFALIAREDAALVALMMAAYALWIPRPRRWVFSAALAGLAVASLVVSFAIVMPAFGAGQTDYGQMYGRWGASMHEVIPAVLRDPLRALAELFSTPGDAADTGLKRLYYLQMLLPLGFLSLASPGTLLIGTPILFEHFLSSRPSQHSIVFHYTSFVTPFVMAASVVGLGNLVRRFEALAGSGRARRLALTLALVALAGSVTSNILFGPLIGMGRLQGIGNPEPLKQDEYERTLQPFRDRMLKRVPGDGDVIAGFEFLSHFTERAGLHAIHHFLAGHYTFSTRRFEVPRGVTAVIADLGHGSLFKHVNPATSARWRELISANDLKPVDSADDLVLFLRGSRDSVELCGPADPVTPRERPLVYDGQVAFVGSESKTPAVPAGGLLPLHTYWRRVADSDRFFLTEIAVVDSNNHGVLELWRYLGYTLHPVHEWAAGVNMRETYNMIVPPGLAPGRYDVGMRLWWRHDGQGVCSVDDPKIQADQGYVHVARFEVLPRPGEARR